MLKVLVTGFEPFGEVDVNPAQLVVETLAQKGVDGVELVTAVLPVDMHQAPLKLEEVVQQTQPDAIVALGVAASREKICLERVFINLLDFGIPDNSGQQVHDQPIVVDGPPAYFTRLPVRAMLQALKQAEIPAKLSLTAGAYLCNQVSYHLLHWLTVQGSHIPAGFVHLPMLPGTKYPSLPLDVMVQGVACIVHTLAQESELTIA